MELISLTCKSVGVRFVQRRRTFGILGVKRRTGKHARLSRGMAHHSLRTALNSGKPAFGVRLVNPGYFHARTVAQSSPRLVWVLVDCEHGLISLVPGASESVAGIASSSASAIVRIPATGGSDSTSWQIKHALDSGAHGVLVPMVSTAEEARKIAVYSRFPPAGECLGSPFARGTWSLNMSLETANQHVLVVVQIETREGVENVEKIAAVEGIDALFTGVYDLSLSLGYAPPSPDPNPDVEVIIQRILRTAHAANKKCGIICTSGTQAASRAAQGFDMISITTDTESMTQAISGHLTCAVDDR
ncbi:hypothetical protein APHAL10511_000757 [Amanita phalloides]|nr:hypothetical protein APHAL10511_000757 [Amanita phalloides]